MPEFNVVSKVNFKEVITSVEIARLSEEEKSSVIISTLGGDVRVYDFNRGEKDPLTERCRIGNLPPLAAIGVGDVTGDGFIDFVMAGLDNVVRVLVYMNEEISVKATTPLGSLPTAIAVLNVFDDKREEVIISTNDGSLRCYGWYDIALDKLAHKVLERPIFSLQPLFTANMPYSRFVFGDDSGHLYVYQYADDRLHERSKLSVGGEVSLVATGDITNNGNSEVVAVSNGKGLNLFGIEKGSLEKIDSIKAPNSVTAIKMGQFWNLHPNRGQIVVSHSNSSIALLTVSGRRLNVEAIIKTEKKSNESLFAIGDIDGDSRNEIVQAVGNNLHILDYIED